ncbi:hypothetical protein GCM10010284_23940 [Streptomyces rubiginosohelvolus]|uniref:Uncharacterized protein n=1 Tax=Streptomyces rubiginosohelvolus TaxID=67362 RepID=A0ABQ3CB68_9ACTN|nr:hypothetical protein GCM10010284_23940 [Streptomyces rubiginosohelvolus]GGZ73621.1 hypothetical protein GCM10010328_55730 [Streptomyces pluricolorescens]
MDLPLGPEPLRRDWEVVPATRSFPSGEAALRVAHFRLLWAGVGTHRVCRSSAFPLCPALLRDLIAERIHREVRRIATGDDNPTDTEDP